jgi:hypothetical protein
MLIHNKPDLIDTITNEGITLERKGKHFVGLCPIHDEKNPSFKVDPEKQTFYCFGCQKYGDVITFIQKYKGISFKDTLSYLGIHKSRRFTPNPRETRKRELVREYKQWLKDYTGFICDALRIFDSVKLRIKTMQKAEAWAWAFHNEPIWEHHFEILLSKDERAKFELYKEVTKEKEYEGKCI